MSNASQRRRALITGATGYIGSNLVRYLVAKDWDVHVIARSGSQLTVLGSLQGKITIHRYCGAIAELVNLVRVAKPDLIFHLASLFLSQHSSEDVDELISSNLLFSTQLVEAAVRNQVKRLINTSSTWLHYNNMEYNPVNLYAATKKAFEDILVYYVNAFRITAVTLELPDTYGPNDPRHKLFSALREAQKNQKILDMSPGAQSIDLVHVNDVVMAYACAADWCLERTDGENVKFRVTSGSNISLRDLVEKYRSFLKNPNAINWGGKPYREREMILPSTIGEAIPGWHPTVCLEAGLREIAAEVTGDVFSN